MKVFSQPAHGILLCSVVLKTFHENEPSESTKEASCTQSTIWHTNTSMFRHSRPKTDWGFRLMNVVSHKGQKEAEWKKHTCWANAMRSDLLQLKHMRACPSLSMHVTWTLATNGTIIHPWRFLLYYIIYHLQHALTIGALMRLAVGWDRSDGIYIHAPVSICLCESHCAFSLS